MTTTIGDQLIINQVIKQVDTIVYMVTPKDNQGAYKFIKLVNLYLSERGWWLH